MFAFNASFIKKMMQDKPFHQDFMPFTMHKDYSHLSIQGNNVKPQVLLALLMIVQNASNPLLHLN